MDSERLRVWKECVRGMPAYDLATRCIPLQNFTDKVLEFSRIYWKGDKKMGKPDWVLEMEQIVEMEDDFAIFMEMEEDDIPQDRIDKMWDEMPHNRPLEGF